MNFQDVIREVYDGTNKALKTTGNFSASLGGNVTLNPSGNFIGIVTVANPGATSGNVTLDPGSKTGLVGNVTGIVRIGGSGFTNMVDAGAAGDGTGNTVVGLYGHSLNHVFNGATWDMARTANIANATTGLGLLGTGVLGFDGTNYRRVKTDTAGNVLLGDPKTYIGLVTITGSLAAASGNVTLDPGSKTGIVGNITLSDPKGFIGLVTVVGSLSAAAGNVTLDDGSLTGLVAGVNSIGFATVHLGTPTIYAVVNTSASSGLATITLNNSIAGIGFATVSVVGTLPDTANSDLDAIATSTSNLDTNGVLLKAGTNQVGSVTVSNPITIGNAMVTVTLGTSLDSTNDSVAIGAALPAGAAYIGLVTATQDSTIFPPRAIMTTNLATPSVSQMATFMYGRNPVDGNWEFVNTIDHNADLASGPIAAGMVAEFDDTSTSTVTENKFAALRMGSDRILYTHPMGNLTLSDAKTYIGLVTATVGNSVTLASGVGNIGFATVTPTTTARSIVGNLTVSISGTSKTLIPMPFALAGTSVATVAVPSNTFKITQFLASANATVGVSIKSGATYLVGNASIRVSLNPNGGWVENGSTDSPVYIGLAGAAAIVVEKDNATTAVAGKVIYFDE